MIAVSCGMLLLLFSVADACIFPRAYCTISPGLTYRTYTTHTHQDTHISSYMCILLHRMCVRIPGAGGMFHQPFRAFHGLSGVWGVPFTVVGSRSARLLLEGRICIALHNPRMGRISMSWGRPSALERSVLYTWQRARRLKRALRWLGGIGG